MIVTVRMATCLALSVGLLGCAASTIGQDPTDLGVADDDTSDFADPAISKSSTPVPIAPATINQGASASGSATDAGSASLASTDAGVANGDASATVTTPDVAPATSNEGKVALATPASASPASTATATTLSAPAAKCSVPSEAGLEDSSKPTTVVGTGTAASCTGSAFVDAVAKAGVITFNCGAEPVTIKLDKTAKVFNDKAQKLVIDGGNKVTLSGGGKVRILYQNTCDESLVWTTPHCDNQEFPQLTVQNLTFEGGNATSESEPSGGAIFAQGGRLKVVNSRFVNNVAAGVGTAVGGGAVRVAQQYNNQPVYVVGSTFGGKDGSGNAASNGGAISGSGASLALLNSTLSYNKAVGNGASPAAEGTPGGGSGGAIYSDANAPKLSVCGSTLEHNRANEGGGGIFFVSGGGTVSIADSTLVDNVSGKFESQPGMFVQASGAPSIVNSTVK